MDIFRKQRRIVVNNRYTQTSSIRNGGLMIRLTMKKLIVLAIILLLLLLWAFFVGVLVGRGVNSDETSDATVENSTSIKINSYASEEHQTAPTPPPVPTQTTAPKAVEPPRAPQTQNATPTDGKSAANRANADTVISPQELSLMSNLKGKPAPPDPNRATTDAPRANAQVTQNTAPKPPRAEAQNNAVTTGRPEDPAPKATTPPGPGIFDYQYQVAATTDLEGAKRLVGQLRADGLRASMVQGSKDGGKLYRVHVDFRGTPSDTNQLREKLSKFGIDRVILKTKVATQ